MNALRLLHLANHNSTNIGNGALISGLERVLREDLPGPVEFAPEPWDDYTIPKPTRAFDTSFVERARSFDGLLVGAAVTLVSSRDYAGAGMRFNLPIERWDELEGPLLFYGLSYRHWPGSAYAHADRLREAIAFASASGRCLFSVRNDGTRAWLADEIGADVSEVHVVPDPALFVVPDPAPHPWTRATDRLQVAVSLNDEDWRSRFAWGPTSSWERVRRRIHPSRSVRRGVDRASKRRAALVGAVVEVLEELARSHDVEFILCPHNNEDLALIRDCIRRCSSRLKYQLLMIHGLPHARFAAQFYTLYRDVDLALAMRVHAMSPSIGLGTPTLALCSQGRMSAFMHEAALEPYALDVFAEDFQARLSDACGRVLADLDGARADMRAATDRMRAQTRKFNELAAGLLSEHGA